MSEQVKYHEIVRPVIEIAQQLGHSALTWIENKILPTDVVSDVFNGQQEIPFED